MVTVPRRPVPLLTLVLIAATTLAFGVASLVAPAPAHAALWTPYTKAYSATIAGKVVLRGNSVVTCDPRSQQCRQAKANRARELDDEDNVDRYVDVDTDRSTFSSSSALVPRTPTAHVVFAGLYWGGDGRDIERPADPDRKTVVKLRTPRSAGYVRVTSTSTGLGTDGSSRPYQGFADVTDLVTAAGSGTYTVADVATTLPGGWGGWALVVAYADPTEPVRTLNVFNGFGSVGRGKAVAVVADGFVARTTGAVAADVGAVVWDGDGSQTGETLTAGGTPVANPANPAANSFNSSVTSDGKRVAGRVPADANTFGTDIDRLRVPTGGVANRAVSTRVRIAAGADTLHTGPIVFQARVQAPDLYGAAEVSTTRPTAGATLSYHYTVDNRGPDPARAARMVADVPLHTRYVAGSLVVGGVAQSDARDRDAAAFARTVGSRGQLSVGLGTGATSSKGGTLVVGNRTTVRFRVKVDADLRARTEVVGVARLAGTGRSSGQRVTAVTAPTRGVVAVAGDSARAPRAADDASSARAEYYGSILVDALRNDTGGTGGNGLTITDVTAGAAGEASAFVDTVSFQYAADTVGLDVFTYALSDGVHSSTGVVWTTVMNDVPTARPDAIPAAAGEPNEVYPLSNDSDPNNDPLAVTGITGLDAGKATAVITGTGDDAPNDTIVVTPAKGFRGTFVFTYTATDARGASATAAVTVKVP